MWALSRTWQVACLLAVTILALSPRIAHAQAPNPRATPVHVLSIDSDDAEDQADALSGALRSRVRTAPAWSLQETSHSLSMLTAALRCPQRPDPACLGRIGDQIHTDRFVWGVMSKSAGNQVTAEVHLWARGKPDAVVKETYSDNLKDQNDETLRKIATRVFEHLTGTASASTVTLHAGDGGGQVLVNGQKKGTLDHGAATLDLAAGSYLIEVHAPGGMSAKQQVTVSAGSDTPLTLKLEKDPQEAAPAEGGSKLNIRRIAGWSAVGVGGVMAIVGVVEGVRFLGLKDDLNNDRNLVNRSVVDVCAADASNTAAAKACNDFHDAKSARTLGQVFGGVGAAIAITGVVLLITEPHSEQLPPPSEAPAARLTPYASPQGAGLDFHMTF